MVADHPTELKVTIVKTAQVSREARIKSLLTRETWPFQLLRDERHPLVRFNSEIWTTAAHRGALALSNKRALARQVMAPEIQDCHQDENSSKMG